MMERTHGCREDYQSRIISDVVRDDGIIAAEKVYRVRDEHGAAEVYNQHSVI